MYVNNYGTLVYTDVVLLQWGLKENPPSVGCQDKLSVGILVDPDKAWSAVDKGPHADSTQVGCMCTLSSI